MGFSGKCTDTGMIPRLGIQNPGLENVTLTITDTICNRDYDFDFLADIVRIDGRVFIPTAFTPNGDNNNEEFKIFGNSCLKTPPSSFTIAGATRFLEVKIHLKSFGTVLLKVNKYPKTYIPTDLQEVMKFV